MHCWSHHPHGTSYYCLPTSCSYWRHTQQHKPVPRLHGHSSRCKNTISCFWHGTQWNSNASYLSAPNARSCAGGYFFLGSIPRDGSPIHINGAVNATCTILKLVAASSAEAELGTLFFNAQEANIIRLVFEKLGHPQPPTSIRIDNTTTVGIVNNTIKQQQSRTTEMRYFWLLDGEAQQLFWLYYQPGQENLGNHPSKHHSADIHQHVCPYFVNMDSSPTFLPWAAKPSSRQGCVKTLADPYKGRIPLTSVPKCQDWDFSCHLIWMGANTPNGQESFHNWKCMKQSFPKTVTE